MKLKYIDHERDVKAGLYIRAYVNTYGECRINIVRIVGPVTTKRSEFAPSSRAVGCHYDGYPRGDVTYLTDMGVGADRTRPNCSSLVRFSNKALTYIEHALTHDYALFQEIVHQRTLTDQELEAYRVWYVTSKVAFPPLKFIEQEPHIYHNFVPKVYGFIPYGTKGEKPLVQRTDIF